MEAETCHSVDHDVLVGRDYRRGGREGSTAPYLSSLDLDQSRSGPIGGDSARRLMEWTSTPHGSFGMGPVRKIRIEELLPERVDLAFPLLQASMPEMTLARWQGFARAALDGKAVGCSRILTAENECGTIVGLAVFRTFADLRHGLALQVEHFFALDLLAREPIAEHLAARLERIAAEEGCVAIHTALPDPPSRLASRNWLAALLQNRGHSVEGLFLCKHLSAG